MPGITDLLMDKMVMGLAFLIPWPTDSAHK